MSRAAAARCVRQSEGRCPGSPPTWPDSVVRRSRGCTTAAYWVAYGDGCVEACACAAALAPEV
eukprot:118578-Chlamydomonas_euryale.AAC.4